MNEYEESKKIREIYGDGRIVELKDYTSKSEYSFLDKMIYKGILRRAKRDGYIEKDMISLNKTRGVRDLEKSRITDKRQIGRLLTLGTLPASLISFGNAIKNVETSQHHHEAVYVAYPQLLLYAVLLPLAIFGVLSARKKYLDYCEEFVEKGDYTGLAMQRLNKQRRR